MNDLIIIYPQGSFCPQPHSILSFNKSFDLLPHDPPLNSPFLVNINLTDKAIKERNIKIIVRDWDLHQLRI